EPGQLIRLPAASKGPRPAASRPAQRAPSSPAPRREPSPGEPHRLHRVQPGETLARIASRYRTTVERLMRLNQDRIEHPSMIQVGQQIRVPSPPATRSRAPAPAKAPAAGQPASAGPPAQKQPPRPPASAPASP
ncbi:MAG: LysM peptidoglycan-binding domain-containing protein, partial [Nitrospinota bacterium]